MAATPQDDFHWRFHSVRPRSLRRNASPPPPIPIAFSANILFRYRKHPGWVKLILIRRVENIAEVGLEEKNDASRFEAAFKDVPKSVWHVYSDAEECYKYIDEVVSANAGKA